MNVNLVREIAFKLRYDFLLKPERLLLSSFS
jgi:hypothetical protein